ncbi:O-methyltransferase [Obba rivulosa]|uniref:O-methyltransferase n=1 Tax=Obba rivulosa TaxID=1052685 RepID=A0A8E2DQ64_9APHY|nr:O-methyltransferase [Obba rivulosa]
MGMTLVCPAALAQIVANGVAAIQAECDSRGVSFPSLDDPYTPESDDIHRDVYSHIIPVIAAAHQLIATLQYPSMYVMTSAWSMHSATTLRAVVAGNVPEILREAGPQGLHINEIAAKANMNASKLSRVMRLLANEHIFKEIAPDVFTHNRPSSTLDTGHSVEFLVKNPQDKYKAATGMSSLCDMTGDESMKGASYLTETLLDPVTANSDEPHHAAFNRAFNTDLSLFPYYDEPGNEFRLTRFSNCMRNYGFFSRSILDALDWAGLPEGSLVVDVGGGVGTTVLGLSRIHQHLRYVVQDRPATVEQGIRVWENERLDALKAGMVQFQGHDFFEPQPIKDASVFILRAIVHDWSDTYAIKIIRQLREAATSETKLVVVDTIVRYTCSSGKEFEDIPGANISDAPAPLLANYGIGGTSVYQIDLQMMVLVNSLERTLRQFVDVLHAGGWKLEHVSRTEGDQMQHLIASPL